MVVVVSEAGLATFGTAGGTVEEARDPGVLARAATAAATTAADDALVAAAVPGEVHVLACSLARDMKRSKGSMILR